jgi:hypothetical protein
MQEGNRQHGFMLVGGRAIDISQGAAARIGMISTGTAPVRLEVIR